MLFLLNKQYTEANFLKSKNVKTLNPLLELHSLKLRSYHLNRKVKVDLYLPSETDVYRSTLLINEGLHTEQSELVKTLTVLLSKTDIPNIGIVAIQVQEKKIEETGITGIPVRKNPGRKAERYANFIVKELTPFLQKDYGLMREEHQNAFAGIGMGGINALNISWDHPNLFRKVGIFSGALPLKEPVSMNITDSSSGNFPEGNEKGEERQRLKFWIQTETSGPGDFQNENTNLLFKNESIHLIEELKSLGYSSEEIIYKETKGRQNNFQARSQAFPEFLKWAFPVKTRIKMPQY